MSKRAPAPTFGAEAGPGTPAISHVRVAPERRPPAPGPATIGDIRSQRGARGLGVLAPSLSGEATGGAGLGVHFVGGVATQGLASSQSPTGVPAGFAPTSGVGLSTGSNTISGRQGNTTPSAPAPTTVPTGIAGRA